jgi:hypothetical protein
MYFGLEAFFNGHEYDKNGEGRVAVAPLVLNPCFLSFSPSQPRKTRAPDFHPI